MKKYFSIFMALVLCLGVFAACSDKESKEPEKITVTINDGSKVTEIEAKKGQTIDKPSDPVKPGHIFDGWVIGEEAVTFPYTVTDSVTISAKFTAEPPVQTKLAYQPIDLEMAIGERNGPWIEVVETRGYTYTYQWYVNTTKSNQGGTPIEGANGAECAINSKNYKPDDVIYVYCEVVGTRASTGQTSSVTSEAAQVKFTAGKKSVLLVGAAVLSHTKNGNDTIGLLNLMLANSGEEYVVDKIVANGSSYNIWEDGLTGIAQEKVKDALEKKAYDYVILQLGRDYVLTTETTTVKEVTAVQNIMSYVASTSPDCKVILCQPSWRNDMTTSYWERFIGVDITDAESHKAAIRAYVTDTILPVAEGAVVADFTTAFEKAIEAGINPFGTYETTGNGVRGVDCPGVEGGYLNACILYSLITGKSSEGMNVSTEVAVVSAADAAKLQKIATELTIK